ncbi:MULTISPECIES: hypothetical protein [unclassified Variovorax]|uniref:hypothetical protein n=1 Tax=unclassified Variovorax TaxID=663243 RepID=UPI00076C7C5A|nr:MULTISPECIES: hypothetical protein [unclassified Variovorax]KWT98077.1 hypothetical protein APY03_0748 [Variovorax sp. WDL1]
MLGESLYVWGSAEEYERNREKISVVDSMRWRHLRMGLSDSFPKGSRKRAFLANFERAVFLKTRPSAAERQRLWSEVAYLNLVPRLLNSRTHRPKDEDFVAGWNQFFPVAAALEAERCIVYGTEPKKIAALRAMPDVQILVQERLPAIVDTRPLHMRLVHGGRELELFFVRHPSAYFPWDEWGPVLRSRGVWLDSTSVPPAQVAEPA